MKIKFCMILILFAFKVAAQDIVTDPKGNFIFGVPTTTIQPQISSNNVGVFTPLIYFNKKLFYIVDRVTGVRYNTMAKSKVLFFKANVVNNSKSTLIFNSKTNVSPSAELGFSWGFDSLMHPSVIKSTYFTFSASIFADYQNFNYYDSITQQILDKKTNRISPGIRTNFSMFKGTAFAFSSSLSFQNSIITDNLTSYQKLTNTFYNDNNIATNGNPDGYMSPVNPTENLRVSFSIPQFWISGRWNDKLPFFITPYYYGLISNGNAPNHNVGFVVGILSQRFRKFDRAEDNSPKDNSAYKFAQAFNIGYNIISTNKENPGYLFVSGTFSLASFRPKSVSSKQIY